MADRLKSGLAELMRQKRRERGAAYDEAEPKKPGLTIAIGMAEPEPDEDDEDDERKRM